MRGSRSLPVPTDIAQEGNRCQFESSAARFASLWLKVDCGGAVASPWDRDIHDVLLIAEVAEGRGEIIDHECEVGGYPPVVVAIRKQFNPDDWDQRFRTPLRCEVLERPLARRGT